jgi:hypothetical protein
MVFVRGRARPAASARSVLGRVCVREHGRRRDREAIGRKTPGSTARGLLAGWLCLAACTGPAKHEGRALLTAVDRYRRADPSAKLAEMQTVVAVSCTDAAVCEAKRACLEAIGPTTRALVIKDEVARRVADIEGRRLAPGSAEAAALPGELDEAEQLLRSGRQRMSECEQKLVEIEVRYGL